MGEIRHCTREKKITDAKVTRHRRILTQFTPVENLFLLQKYDAAKMCSFILINMTELKFKATPTESIETL